MKAATISRLQSETSTASRQRSASLRSMSSSSRSILDGSVARERGWAGGRRPAFLPLGGDGERQRPVLAGSAVYGEPPLVPARLERERRGVHGHGEVERRAGLQPGRTPHLELATERDDLIRVLVVLESDGHAVPVEKLDPEIMPPVRLVPPDPYEEGHAEARRLGA